MAVQQHVLNWLYSVLTSEYQDVNRTYNDVAFALSQFPSLSPRTDVHTFPNGASALLLHLSGTLPAYFRGTTYRYPISLWVPHAYPREAPFVYVTPTENMMVRPGQHVDPQGQVYHPYLVGWSDFWDKSTIADFLAILRDVFSKEPPVIARNVPRPQQALPPSTPPPPVPPLPQELASSPQPPAALQPPAGPVPPPRGGSLSSTTSDAASSVHPAAQHTPSPPPVPPHPSTTSGAGTNRLSSMMHDQRFGYATAQSPAAVPNQSPAGHRTTYYDAPQALTMAEAGTGPRSDSPTRQGGPPGAPPVPGRPPYQQSPLSQPPLSPAHQRQLPPQQLQMQATYPPYQQQPQPQPQQQTSSPPAPPLAPAGFSGPQTATLPSYYTYNPQNQQQPPHMASPQPPLQQHPQPHMYQQQAAPQYQQQQHRQQQQQPPWQQQQQTAALPHPRPKMPPPPDLMDDDPTPAGPAGASSAAGGGAGVTTDVTLAAAAAAPPVPPNPEKDALLHQLAQTLADMRQRSRLQNETTLAGLQAQREAMLAAASRLQQELSGTAQLSALLTSNTTILHETLQAADAVVENSRQTSPPAIDDLLVGPTVVANQLYDLVAEERALADAIFMLGRSVERGRISPAVFAKMVRSLSREWYLKKALVRKIGRGMGLIEPVNSTNRQ